MSSTSLRRALSALSGIAAALVFAISLWAWLQHTERARYARCNRVSGYWDDDKRVCAFFNRCPWFVESGAATARHRDSEPVCEVSEQDLPQLPDDKDESWLIIRDGAEPER